MDEQAIESAFCHFGNPIRKLLSDMMEKHKIYEHGQSYKQIYDNLRDKDCVISGKKGIDEIKLLLLHLSVDYMDILTELANASCKIPNRTLLEEINAYFGKIEQQLKQQLARINTKIISSTSDAFTKELLKQKKIFQDKILQNRAKMLNQQEYDRKVRMVKSKWQYRIMRLLNNELSDLEILSIVLYCEENGFCTKMRESQREQHLNSCEWRQLFRYLHSAIKKLHKVL